MKILGISSFYHDSAAALIVDGQIIAAAQEERFSRKKHDHRFPHQAIEYCLSEIQLTPDQLDHVVFYDKPFVKFERLLETYLAYAPYGFRSFLQAIPLWIKEKLWIPDIIQKELDYAGSILFSDHHDSHAASAFFPSPFSSAAIMTIDGVGEWTTASWGIGRENHFELTEEIRFPHSLGLLYSAFTYYLGFKVNSGEYKVMGLAPYGDPRYVDLILDHLMDLKSDGSFRFDMSYFNYCAGLTMTNDKFHRLFGGQPRQPETDLTQKEMDLARSVQEVTEEVMLKQARHVRQQSGEPNLCLAGGVALNCVGNGKILREGIFDNIWIQPAAGDAGGALGAALDIYYRYLGQTRQTNGNSDLQHSSLLGPSFGHQEIAAYLSDNQLEGENLTDAELFTQVARLLDQEQIIGWFQGRMEFGPRALGNRSILGDPRSEKTQSVMNLKIKYRESFRPFAPSILIDDVNDYFEMEGESPYMLIVAPVQHKIRRQVTADEERLFGIDRLNIARSEIPAVTHVDYSARVQTVSESEHPRYYNLIQAFKELTGCPVLVNTSFNVRGEPIVCTPDDAYRCFMRTEMDYLVLGNYLLNKKKQIPLADDINWRDQFELD
ncbi:hypothetical protein CMK18_08615 [Candidatus Poribacteria bacterium]|nr:hypothetical protein [Candidatus Poribacteria bacterium]